MKLKKLFIPALAAAGLAAASGAYAGKIAVVSAERILSESSLAQQSEQTLRKEFSGRQKSITNAAKAFKSKVDAYQKEKSSLTEEQRKAREKALSADEIALQRRDRELREDLNRRRNEELHAILVKANAIIADIAKKEGYELVLQEAVWADPSIDITDRVMKAMPKR